VYFFPSLILPLLSRGSKAAGTGRDDTLLTVCFGLRTGKWNGEIDGSFAILYFSGHLLLFFKKNRIFAQSKENKRHKTMRKILFDIKTNKQILSLLMLLLLAACGDNYSSSIPSYPVSLRLNLATGYPLFRNSVNQFLLFEKPILTTDRMGYGGILLCSGELNGYGNSQYFAYDLSCPVEAKRTVKLRALQDDFCKVKCDECTSEYYVGNGLGMPTFGPAKEALKQYRTSLSGDILIVSAK
jgi:hypothetical protein